MNFVSEELVGPRGDAAFWEMFTVYVSSSSYGTTFRPEGDKRPELL